MRNLRLILLLFLINILFNPVISWASSNVFRFSTFNNSQIILSNSADEKVGYDGQSIYGEISDSEIFLNGNFTGVEIKDISDGLYKINLKNNNDIYEKTILTFFSDNQVISQRTYFFLKKENQILFEIKNGELTLGKNYSLIKKLRLKKTDWKLTWEDTEADKFHIYGKKPAKRAFEYIGETNDQEYILIGNQKDFEEYAVTKIFSDNPHVESGIFTAVLGGTVFVEDADEDGISDEWENVLGTDKNLADSDGDGVNDLDEILDGKNPLEKPKPSGHSGPKHKRKKQKDKKNEEIKKKEFKKDELKQKEEVEKTEIVEKQKEARKEVIIQKTNEDRKQEKKQKKQDIKKEIFSPESQQILYQPKFEKKKISREINIKNNKTLKNQTANIIKAPGSDRFVKSFFSFWVDIWGALKNAFINLFNWLKLLW